MPNFHGNYVFAWLFEVLFEVLELANQVGGTIARGLGSLAHNANRKSLNTCSRLLVNDSLKSHSPFLRMPRCGVTILQTKEATKPTVSCYQWPDKPFYVGAPGVFCSIPMQGGKKDIQGSRDGKAKRLLP